MYSLHSWCGMVAFVLYLLQVRVGEPLMPPRVGRDPTAPRNIPAPPQWLLGCGFFLFPGASLSLRSRYKPQHVFIGIALFVLSITACLMGITETLLFNIRWVTAAWGVLAPPNAPDRQRRAALAPCGGVWPLLRTRLSGC